MANKKLHAGGQGQYYGWAGAVLRVGKGCNAQKLLFLANNASSIHSFRVIDDRPSLRL